MAAKSNSGAPDKSPKPANKIVNVPNPDRPPHHVLVKMGSKITWKLNGSEYPKFQLHFGMWNPFDGRKFATFTGNKGKPLSLVTKNAGGFTYSITHTKRGSKRHTGTYGITVQSPNIGPHGGCPPACG
jgi:hypothetical protein